MYAGMYTHTHTHTHHFGLRFEVNVRKINKPSNVASAANPTLEFHYLIYSQLIFVLSSVVNHLQRIVHEADPEYLFSPVDGEAKLERHALEAYFPTNYTGKEACMVT